LQIVVPVVIELKVIELMFGTMEIKKSNHQLLKEEKSESILKKQYHWSFSAIRVSVN
jgi:hypothetical protein